MYKLQISSDQTMMSDIFSLIEQFAFHSSQISKPFDFSTLRRPALRSVILSKSKIQDIPIRTNEASFPTHRSFLPFVANAFHFLRANWSLRILRLSNQRISVIALHSAITYTIFSLCPNSEIRKSQVSTVLSVYKYNLLLLQFRSCLSYSQASHFFISLKSYDNTQFQISRQIKLNF